MTIFSNSTTRQVIQLAKPTRNEISNAAECRSCNLPLFRWSLNTHLHNLQACNSISVRLSVCLSICLSICYLDLKAQKINILAYTRSLYYKNNISLQFRSQACCLHISEAFQSVWQKLFHSTKNKYASVRNEFIKQRLRKLSNLAQ